MPSECCLKFSRCPNSKQGCSNTAHFLGIWQNLRRLMREFPRNPISSQQMCALIANGETTHERRRYRIYNDLHHIGAVYDPSGPRSFLWRPCSRAQCAFCLYANHSNCSFDVCLVVGIWVHDRIWRWGCFKPLLGRAR